jgi:hypothetical protein
VLGPEDLTVLRGAFDAAWSIIAGNFADDSIAAGRLRLANALLSVADEDCRDVKALKNAALEAMALGYRNG